MTHKLIGILCCTLSLFVFGCMSEGTKEEALAVDENPHNWQVEQGVSGYWGYVDSSGTIMIPYRFVKAHQFKDSIAIVIDSLGYYNIINPKGESLVKEGLDFIEDFEDREVSVAFTVVKGEKVYRFVGKDGWLSKEQYLGIYYSKDAKAYICVTSCDTCLKKQYSQIHDTHGQVLSDRYDYIEPFYHTTFFKALNYKGDKKAYAVINSKGALRSDWYKEIFRPNELGYFEYIDQSQDRFNIFGLIDSTGKVLLPRNYAKIDFYYENGLVNCKEFKGATGEDSYHLYDFNFQDLGIRSKYIIGIYPNVQVIAVQEKKSSYSFYVLEVNQFKKVGDSFDMPLVNGSYEKRFLLIFPTGMYKDYSSYVLPHFYQGKAIVMRNNKFGMVDSKGFDIVPLIYDSIQQSPDSTITAWKNGVAVSL